MDYIEDYNYGSAISQESNLDSDEQYDRNSYFSDIEEEVSIDVESREVSG